ncbi:methyl-accepting chemotaxis protein [Magnetococcus sp. PR-3]|uniref:methyl-accepting chemotaxis protein n=1 Tax=Magnetococcus sp. PR-3 TaxID=3120355 RepID=UPI002FCDECF1
MLTSVRAKILAALASIAILVTASSAMVVYRLAASEDDTARINALGRQRMLSQAMGKSALGYAAAQAGNTARLKQINTLNSYITNMRKVYTQTVVKAAKQGEWRLSKNPQSLSHPALPFPATYTRLVNEAFGGLGGEISVDILAKSPINPAQKLKTEQDSKAQLHLKKDSSSLFMSEPLNVNGALYLSYYSADRATAQACVDCHNAMGSGETYALGDVLGIRRFDVRVSKDYAAGLRTINPSLAEYKTAKTIFQRTLQAVKVGGDYPANLKMSTNKRLEAMQSETAQHLIANVEKKFTELDRSVQQLLTPGLDENHLALAREAVLVQSNQLRTLSNNLVVHAAQVADENRAQIFWALGMGGALVALLLMAITVFLNRSVIQPVTRLADLLSRVGEGDLTVDPPKAGADEVGRALRALQGTVKNLTGIITGIKNASIDLQGFSSTLVGVTQGMDQQSNLVTHSAQDSANATSEMSQQMSAIADSAELASSRLQEVSHSADEMSENMGAISAASEEASVNLSTVASATEEAGAGMQSVTQASERMNENVTSVETSMAEMRQAMESVCVESEEAGAASRQATEYVANSAQVSRQLSDSAQEIGKVVEMINNIAAQTNMLALNASIEAAGAGEAGKGFAVVANEVKDLASQTSNATQQISQRIEDIRANARETVRSMTEVSDIVNSINEKNQIIQESITDQQENLNTIYGSMRQVSEETTEVNQRVSESSAGIDEVTRSATEISTGISEVTRNVATAASGVEQMSRNVVESSKSSQEISHNVSQAQVKSKTMSESMQRINIDIQQMDGMGAMVAQFSQDISAIAQLLEQQVVRFKIPEEAVDIQSDFKRVSVWGPKYMLNIPVIDLQHMRLFALSARLRRAIEKGLPLMPIVMAMDSYARWHLQFEEILFKQTGWPGIAEHAQLHKDLRADLDKFGERLGAPGTNPENLGKELSDFVETWLSEHISVEDRVYAKWMKENVPNLDQMTQKLEEEQDY